MVKKRSLSGNVGIGVFVIALICIIVAFCSSSWLVSDYRITGANFNRLGLWEHCFRSLKHPQDEYERRFFVGCHWLFDPITKGYDEIKGFLRPNFMIATQFFYTLAFIGVLASFLLVILFFLCFGPEHKHLVLLVTVIGATMIGVGVTSGIAVIIFAIWANKDDWMSGHDNNFFGWAFGVAIAGTFAALIAGALFLVEATVQKKKRKYLKESQTQFHMEMETKA